MAARGRVLVAAGRAGVTRAGVTFDPRVRLGTGALAVLLALSLSFAIAATRGGRDVAAPAPTAAQLPTPARAASSAGGTVTLGSARYSVTGGATAAIKIALNGRGKTLLEHHRTLPAKVTLTPSGARTPIATKTVMIVAANEGKTNH